MAENYSLGVGVDLSMDLKKKVKDVADAYHKSTKKKIVITSGTRTAKSQADAMYTKLQQGDDLKIYADQNAAGKIKKIYENGVKVKKGKDVIISEMEKEIDSQIAEGVYISKHLKKGAIDVRSRDMTFKEKESFKEAAKGVADTVILETTPPHFHLQF